MQHVAHLSSFFDTVTLSGLIAAWRTERYTPEELQVGFPALTLAQVYGALAYYLDHEQELDAVFAADDRQYAEQRERDRPTDPDFYRRLDERRAQVSLGQSDQDGSAGPRDTRPA